MDIDSHHKLFTSQSVKLRSFVDLERKIILLGRSVTQQINFISCFRDSIDEPFHTAAINWCKPGVQK